MSPKNSITLLVIVIVFISALLLANMLITNIECSLSPACKQAQRVEYMKNIEQKEEWDTIFLGFGSGMLWLFNAGKYLLVLGVLLWLIKRTLSLRPKNGMYPIMIMPKVWDWMFKDLPNLHNDPTSQYLQAATVNGKLPAATAKNIILATQQANNTTWSIEKPVEVLDVEYVDVKPLPTKSYIYDQFDHIDPYKPGLLIADTSSGKIHLPFENQSGILLGGQTGSGKSEALASMIVSCIQQSPLGDTIRLGIIDMKQIDFSPIPDTLPILEWPVAYEDDTAFDILNYVFDEMKRRQELWSTVNARSIHSYNSVMPVERQEKQFVLIIDELADITLNLSNQQLGKDFRNMLYQLLRKCRAFGIFIIAATQHPSTKVIPTEIRGQFSMQIAFRTKDRWGSEAILASVGAEALPNIPGRCIVNYKNGLETAQCFMAGLDEKISPTVTRFDAEILKLSDMPPLDTLKDITPVNKQIEVQEKSNSAKKWYDVSKDVQVGRYKISDGRKPSHHEAAIMRVLHNQMGWSRNMILGVHPKYSGFYGYKDDVTLNWVNKAINGEI